MNQIPNREHLKEWLAEALRDRRGIVWNNEARYIASYRPYANPFWIERVEGRDGGNSYSLPGRDGISVDVTLAAEDIEYDKRLAGPDDEGYDEDGDVWLDADGDVIEDMDAHEREIDELAWGQHVEENLDAWVDDVLEQIGAAEGEDD